MNKQTGSALISALFIMTLVAIIATAMSTRLQQDIYLTQRSLDRDALYLASQAVTFWAMDTLSDKNNSLNKLNKDGSVARFPLSMQSAYPGVIINGAMFDLQARYNLNTIQSPEFKPLFKHLLTRQLKLGEEQTEELLAATLKWMEKTTDVKPNQPKKTLVAFKDISEFRTVPGISATRFVSLSSVLTALPKVTAININTASIPVLRILGDGLTKFQVSELIQLRHNRQSPNYPTQRNELLKKLNINPNTITENSGYFLAKATISKSTMTLTVYTILERLGTPKDSIRPLLILQRFNEE